MKKIKKTLAITTLALLLSGTTMEVINSSYAQAKESSNIAMQMKTPPEKPVGNPGEKPDGFGGSGQINQGSTANEITENKDVENEKYESSGDDENALRVTNAETKLKNVEIDKNDGKSSNTEDGDFYGMNAGLLATDKARVNIENSTVKTNAQNGNGIFSYGEGTIVNVSDTTIETEKDNSGGIQTTGGAEMNVKNLKVKTKGNSSAAIRSDRGGGNVNVESGDYVTTGYNSPAIYSTANIKVKDASLKAENSEALVIEGQNSISLENCYVEGNMSDDKGSSSDTNVHNVMIYQSMSGDAEVGKSEFSMKDGKLVGKNGDLIYVTNTTSDITLENVEINNEDSDARLLAVLGNDASHGWGTAGSNGANVNFTAKNQKLNGKIEVDTISTLKLSLTNDSEFTGTITVTDNADGGTKVDNNAEVEIEEGSTWNLTGDVKISKLTNKGKINFNGYTITLEDGTVLS